VFLSSARTGRAGTRSFRIEEDFVPLKDADNTDSRGTIKIKNFLSLPIDDQENPLDKVPATETLVINHLRALGGELAEGLIRYPHKVDGVMMFNGEPMEKGTDEQCKKIAKQALLDKLVAIWENPSMMHGYVAFAKVAVDGEYNKITTLQAELPEGEELVPEREWFV
jgi:hypothetical protein